MTTFDIVLTTLASLHPDGEPSDFVSEYGGVITATGDDGVTTEVGRLSALKVHAGLAADHGEPLFDVCDCHSQELHLLHTLLYEFEGYDFKDALVRRFEAPDGDLLVLDHVVLDPRWRGLRVGLLAVRKVVDLLGGGCGLAVAEIAPLRREASEYLDVTTSVVALCCWPPTPLHGLRKRNAVSVVQVALLWVAPRWAMSRQDVQFD